MNGNSEVFFILNFFLNSGLAFIVPIIHILHSGVFFPQALAFHFTHDKEHNFSHIQPIDPLIFQFNVNFGIQVSHGRDALAQPLGYDPSPHGFFKTAPKGRGGEATPALAEFSEKAFFCVSHFFPAFTSRYFDENEPLCVLDGSFAQKHIMVHCCPFPAIKFLHSELALGSCNGVIIVIQKLLAGGIPKIHFILCGIIFPQTAPLHQTLHKHHRLTVLPEELFPSR
mmetsp:Transcript_50154/g.150980  ORF Transcript_50154/g.150980 Transcript_50154/m.150980 type:complete len:226 (+) Transcript_50154:292-969(+)